MYFQGNVRRVILLPVNLILKLCQPSLLQLPGSTALPSNLFPSGGA